MLVCMRTYVQEPLHIYTLNVKAEVGVRCLIVLRQGFLLNLELPYLARLTGSSCLHWYCPTSARVTDVLH